MTDSDTATHSFRSWLGIPYATAERFRRSILLPFNPDRSYDQYGPAPLQAGDASWLGAENGFSEDCLNLNVWAPKEASDEPLPVIVYIFGGGFEVGDVTYGHPPQQHPRPDQQPIGVGYHHRRTPGAAECIDMQTHAGHVEHR